MLTEELFCLGTAVELYPHGDGCCVPGLGVDTDTAGQHCRVQCVRHHRCAVRVASKHLGHSGGS